MSDTEVNEMSYRQGVEICGEPTGRVLPIEECSGDRPAETRPCARCGKPAHMPAVNTSMLSEEEWQSAMVYCCECEEIIQAEREERYREREAERDRRRGKGERG